MSFMNVISWLCLEWDPYSKVKSMLRNLKLQDLLPKFFDNCIRVSFTFGHCLLKYNISATKT